MSHYRWHKDPLSQFTVFYYGVHTPDIDARIKKARPGYVIINSPHGLWGQMAGQGTFQDVAGYRAAGIKVIGYLTAGYEAAGSAGQIPREWYSLESNLRLIRDMAEIDRLDGVFIDECSDYPSEASRTYLDALTGLCHNYDLITWGNVGVATFDDWFFTEGGFDLMHSSEDWRGQGLTEVQRKWARRIGVTSTSPRYSASDALGLTTDAWSKGLAYCYVSNEYTVLPPWFEEYAMLLRSSQRRR